MTFAILIYAAAMVGANLSIAAFGPTVSPINAFVLIGLDLALRDYLHLRLRPHQMLLLIAATGVLTFMLNPAAGQIALASAVAFSLAAGTDWLTFQRLRGSWLYRSNGSNLAGAAVDSIVFPLLAFGGLRWDIAVAMFLAKVAGGALWALALNRMLDRPRAA